MWTYLCSDMFLFGGGWKGEQLQLSTGIWESFIMLRMTAMWEGDTVWRHCLEEHRGLFVEWPSGRRVTKLHFVGIQQYLLNECVYFHQWHTKAARSAWGYQFISFYSGLGAHRMVTYPAGDQEFHASISWSLNILVVKRLVLTRFDPSCQVCMRVRCWFLALFSTHTFFCMYELRGLRVL